MALVTGCRFGRPGQGGRPRQCASTVVATIHVINDERSIVPMDVCQEHYEHFLVRLMGTLYTEDASGQPTPDRVKLYSLT